MQNEQSEEWLKNLPTQAENPAFDAAEMIQCERCARSNPPNRLNCLYCGAELAVSDAQTLNIQPNLRRLEAWEKGFNLIAESFGEQTNFAKAARLLKVESRFVQQIADGAKKLPLARVESAREAEILQSNLAAFDLQTTIVSDESLRADKMPRRLRGIEFDGDEIFFILFNQDEIVRIPNEDLLLIVSGAIFERKIEATEKRVKKGENKILDSRETASDESLLDVYTRNDADGFRIWAKGFDFSGLGAEKKMLASENLKKLAEKFLEVAPNARVVADYLSNRELLGDVWEVEQKNESSGWKRESFGKFNLENVTTVSNLTQFTKYSRLQRELV